MECERMDSLEGWVAVRPNMFEEPEQYRLSFIVAWNQVESKFAVTCHNRTLQRRRRREEVASDGPQSSWAGLYSVQDLEHIQRQLSCVSSRLEHCFPSLPAPQPAGSMWTLLFPGAPSWEGSSEELDAVCRALEVYLGSAIEQCGWKIVRDVMFPEELEDSEQYFENLHEFRRKSLEELLTRAKEKLRMILHQHKNADQMIGLLKVYEEEDEAYVELVTVATQFYQYLMQPFRDTRELAILYKLEILKSLEMDELGPKRIEALQKEADKWNTRAEEAVRFIQSVTVDYFKETSKALAAMQKQMELDRRRFGKTTWSLVQPRLERIKSMLAKESLQHMRSKEMCLNQKRGDIKRNMENLGETEGAMVQVDELELQYYETQLELYEVQFDILKHEEMLLIAELNTLQRQMREKQEEVVYYDTCEDPQELQTFEQSHNNHSSIYALKGKSQQLESKRGNICARRALLRNKKDQCIEARELKQKQYQETQKQLQQHHSAQMKKDKKKEEDRKKKEWVDQERQKTLQRLKSFKEKKESHVVLKTSRIKSCLSRKAPESLKASCVTKGHRDKPTDIPVQMFVQTGNPQHGTPNDEASKSTSHLSPLPTALLPAPPLPPPPPPLPPPPPPLAAFLTGQVSLPVKPNEHHKSTDKNSETKTIMAPSKKCFGLHSGSMEEVLASLKRGENLLHKTEQPQASINSVRDNILTAIKQGVKLRKVTKDNVKKEEESELEQSIKAAMQRMRNISNDSDEEAKSEYTSGEWDT